MVEGMQSTTYGASPGFVPIKDYTELVVFITGDEIGPPAGIVVGGSGKEYKLICGEPGQIIPTGSGTMHWLSGVPLDE